MMPIHTSPDLTAATTVEIMIADSPDGARFVRGGAWRAIERERREEYG